MIALRLRPKPSQGEGGGHLIVQVFLAPDPLQTFANCGEIMIRKEEWAELAVQKALTQITAPTEVTERLTFVGRR